MLAAFNVILMRDLTLAFRHPSQINNPLVFFAIVVTLFPLSLGPEVNMLQRIAPGVIWVGALLAAMLSLENIFYGDYEDGSLEHLLLSPYPFSLFVTAKVIAHWLVTGLPALLLAPVLGHFYRLPAESIGVLMITLLLGTPVLSLIGAIGVALTVTQRRGGVLVSMLVLPLYIPILIFATTAVDQAAGGLPIDAHLSFMGALLLFSLALAPWAASAALRVGLE